MPNYDVFNHAGNPLNTGVYGQNTDGTWQTIRSNSNNSLVLTSQEELFTRAGEYYNTTTGSQTVVTNGFLVVQVTNPLGSGKDLHFGDIVGGSITNTTIDFLINATFSASGSSITPQNRNSGFVNGSVATAKWISQATDPTTGGVLASSLIQTGDAVSLQYAGTWIIVPNTTVIIRLANNSTVSNLLGISIAWWEETI